MYILTIDKDSVLAEKTIEKKLIQIGNACKFPAFLEDRKCRWLTINYFDSATQSKA